MPEFTTKDSGRRAQFAGGGQRDTEEGKPRFDLLIVKGIPYTEQPLYRVAMLMARGVAKYGDRNWELFADDIALDRAGSSGFRHLFQDLCGEIDEDHPAAEIFNAIARMSIRHKKEIADGGSHSDQEAGSESSQASSQEDDDRYPEDDCPDR